MDIRKETSSEGNPTVKKQLIVESLKFVTLMTLLVVAIIYIIRHSY